MRTDADVRQIRHKFELSQFVLATDTPFDPRALQLEE